uniref:RAP domain-containing protein n=1 Tax=Neospora caninum (strain Liverpool) TaxID=572307 RepID=A0A0F7UDQ3_NEOCL|nr:TPA: hypothetical protein BN1204_022790 [Neospora caninum Liverpool]
MGVPCRLRGRLLPESRRVVTRRLRGTSTVSVSRSSSTLDSTLGAICSSSRPQLPSSPSHSFSVSSFPSPCLAAGAFTSLSPCSCSSTPSVSSSFGSIRSRSSPPSSFPPSSSLPSLSPSCSYSCPSVFASLLPFVSPDFPLSRRVAVLCPSRAELLPTFLSLLLPSSAMSRHQERFAHQLYSSLSPQANSRLTVPLASPSSFRPFVSSSRTSSSSLFPPSVRASSPLSALSPQVPCFCSSLRSLRCRVVSKPPLSSRLHLEQSPSPFLRSSDSCFFSLSTQTSGSERTDTLSRWTDTWPRRASTPAKCMHTAGAAALGVRERGERREASGDARGEPSKCATQNSETKRASAPALPASQCAAFAGDSSGSGSCWIEPAFGSLESEPASCAPRQTRQRLPRLPCCSTEASAERRQDTVFASRPSRERLRMPPPAALTRSDAVPLPMHQTHYLLRDREDDRLALAAVSSPFPQPLGDCLSLASNSPAPSYSFPPSPASSPPSLLPSPSLSSCSPSSPASVVPSSPSPGAVEQSAPQGGLWGRGDRGARAVRGVLPPSLRVSGMREACAGGSRETERSPVARSPPVSLPQTLERNFTPKENERRRVVERGPAQNLGFSRRPAIEGSGDRLPGGREGERGRGERERLETPRPKRGEREGVAARSKKAQTVVGKLMEEAVDLVEAFEAFKEDARGDREERRGKLQAFQTKIFKVHQHLSHHVHEATADELLELRGHVEALLMRQKLVVDRRLLLPLLEELYKRDMIDTVRMSTLVRYFRDLCDTNQGDLPAPETLIKRVHASIMARQVEFLENRDLGNALLLFLYNCCLLRLPTGDLYPEWARRSLEPLAGRVSSHEPLKISPPLVVFVSRILIAERCGNVGAWQAVLNLTLSIDPRTSPFFFAAALPDSADPRGDAPSAVAASRETSLDRTTAAHGDIGRREEASDWCRYTPGDEAQWLANATRTASGAAAMGIPFHPALEIIFDRVAEAVREEGSASFQALFACQAERHSCRLLQYIWSLCFYNFHLREPFPAILQATCKHGRLEHAAQYLLNFGSPAFLAEAVMFARREDGWAVRDDLSVLCKENLEDILTCVRPSCSAWASNFLSPHPNFRADFERHLTLNAVRFSFINRRGVSCLHLLDLKGDGDATNPQRSLSSSPPCDERREHLSPSSPSSASSPSPSSSPPSSPVCVVLIDLARQPRDLSRGVQPGLLGGHILHNRLLRRLGWEVRVVCQSEWNALDSPGKHELIKKIIEKYAPDQLASCVSNRHVEGNGGR